MSSGKRIVNTLWVSDVHLGSRNSEGELLARLLSEIDCNRLYLVGDIIDLTGFEKKAFWSKGQTLVVQALLKKVDAGVEVIYIPGNHDYSLRQFCDRMIQGIHFKQSDEFHSLAGENYLVIHGDELDADIFINPLARAVGDSAYSSLLFINRWINWFGKLIGIGFIPLATKVKQQIPMAMHAIESYEIAVSQYAAKLGFDGVVCGHIHMPANKQIEQVHYLNTGDWVESGSALVESLDGSFEIIHYLDECRVKVDCSDTL